MLNPDGTGTIASQDGFCTPTSIVSCRSRLDQAQGVGELSRTRLKLASFPFSSPADPVSLSLIRTSLGLHSTPQFELTRIYTLLYLQSLHEELSELDPDATDLDSLSHVRTELIHRTILFHKESGQRFSFLLSLAFRANLLLLPPVPESRPSPLAASPTSSSSTLPMRPTTREGSGLVLVLPPRLLICFATQLTRLSYFFILFFVLQDIFTFILTLLSQQLTPSRSTSSGARAATHPTKNEFYKQYYYLIESMSTCKSVILMLDTEEIDDDMVGGGEDSLVARMFKEFFDLVR